MKLARPDTADAWRSDSGRMRNDSRFGSWVKKTAYDEMRDYALALESRLRKIEEGKGSDGK